MPHLKDIIFQRIKRSLVIASALVIICSALIYIAASFWNRLHYVDKLVLVTASMVDTSVESLDLDAIIAQLENMTQSKEIGNICILDRLEILS